MAYIDYKVTSWVRMEIDDEQLEEAQELIKEGVTPSDLDIILNPTDINNLFEVEEYLPVEENGGQATIELYTNGSILVYSNDKNN
jgi:hypothetical protein